MNAGKLRFRVRIKNPVEVDAGNGNFTTTWPADAADDGEVWANVEPLSQIEKFWASQQQSIATHKITCRYTDTITPKSRLIQGDHTYHVTSVVPDRLKREVVVQVAEEVA